MQFCKIKLYEFIKQSEKGKKFVMKNKRKKDIEKKDNVTLYGENVCTEFEWLPLDKQKENAEKFDKITKKKK